MGPASCRTPHRGWRRALSAPGQGSGPRGLSAPTAFVDSHCHLGLLDVEERDAALIAARDAGLTHIVDVGLDIASTWEALERAERTDIVRIGVGVGWHPHQGRAPVAEELEELAALCRHPRAVAVGEIGLDHHFTEWHQAPAEVQRSALRVMLQLARDAGLPVIIHSRETDAEMLEALSDFPGLHGVMHCFLGDIDHARACLDLGYSLSLAGPLTYPRSEALREVARSVPLERLLVETDSPFLPPQSRRGRRNEPAMVAETVARLARERGIPEAEARAVTGANSLRLFPRLIG